MLTTLEGIYENGQIILNEQPAIKRRVKVIVTFMDEKTDIVEPATRNKPSAQLRGAWKNVSPEDKQEINTYFDSIRNEWERDI